MTKRKDPKEHKKDGRPTKMTPDTIKKLEESAAIDASVEEMCFYADISTTTFYNYCKENPDFLDRITNLRNKPVLKARTEVVKGLDNDKHFSLQYLTKKKSNEFGDTMKHQHSGTIAADPADTDLTKDLSDIREKYEVELRERIRRGVATEPTKAVVPATKQES